MQMRQLDRLPVKSERWSLGMGATQRGGVRGGSPPAFHPIRDPMSMHSSSVSATRLSANSTLRPRYTMCW
jgi:hypothetical protein